MLPSSIYRYDCFKFSGSPLFDRPCKNVNLEIDLNYECFDGGFKQTFYNVSYQVMLFNKILNGNNTIKPEKLL